MHQLVHFPSFLFQLDEAMIFAFSAFPQDGN